MIALANFSPRYSTNLPGTSNRSEEYLSDVRFARISVFASVLLATLLIHLRPVVAQPISLSRPRLFITSQPVEGLRNVEQLKDQIRTSEHLAALWKRLLLKARADASTEEINPRNYQSPDRPEQNRKIGNPDYTVCRAARQRILRNALTSVLVTDPSEQRKHRDVALKQIATLFDERSWPDWRDQAHRRYPLDLRNGSLGRDIAIAYDWLYPQLLSSERKSIVDGLDRRVIGPFWEAVDKDVGWVNGRNNWTTCIVGGLGIVGMALTGDHPDADRLVEFSQERMLKYLSHYGRDGEFNESVGYSSATRLPVVYFTALRYASGNKENRLAKWPFVETAIWNAHTLVPPGRFVAFGDAHPERIVSLEYFAPIAAASGNEFLQRFYLNQHGRQQADIDLPLGLLGFDPSVAARDPTGNLPLGRRFTEHGAIMVSRTSWQPDSTECVVYGKAGIEQNHEHHDAGQVCIDGFGDRLIVDVGSPSSYPADFFGSKRWNYYNASSMGHNVISTDQEMRAPRGAQADVLRAEFDDERGGYWQLDLTDFYVDAERVTRTVVHLLPGIIAVLDDASFSSTKPIALRWHTKVPADRRDDGTFVVATERAKLVGRLIDVNGTTARDAKVEISTHRYSPPFDRSRNGEPLVQRNESFLMARHHGKSVKYLTLFTVTEADDPTSGWHPTKDGFEVAARAGTFSVRFTEGKLRISQQNSDRDWNIATSR